jgi:hypothetical protein
MTGQLKPPKAIRQPAWLVHFKPLFGPSGGLDDIDHVRDKAGGCLSIARLKR